ncbi:unnamed protein product [Arabis nemorensis]|uniref:Neprosin PEP catalytic domain-containing protein n=1 Tax=Arabis nemorensis TaxID=586526 RepID=A0A565CI72_9BRAS|nr:unnamed protein product [Arabis nemorensis]
MSKWDSSDIEKHKRIADVKLQDQRPYRGIASWISVHDLNISGDQASFARIYVGSAINNKVNSIQTGWMINPSLFGDSRSWSYGFWKGANGVGCYRCPGFVQVSKTDPLFGPLPQAPEGERNIGIAIHQVVNIQFDFKL